MDADELRTGWIRTHILEDEEDSIGNITDFFKI